jgi:hypothetical protein
LANAEEVRRALTRAESITPLAQDALSSVPVD